FQYPTTTYVNIKDIPEEVVIPTVALCVQASLHQLPLHQFYTQSLMQISKLNGSNLNITSPKVEYVSHLGLKMNLTMKEFFIPHGYCVSVSADKKRTLTRDSVLKGVDSWATYYHSIRWTSKIF